MEFTCDELESFPLNDILWNLISAKTFIVAWEACNEKGRGDSQGKSLASVKKVNLILYLAPWLTVPVL